MRSARHSLPELERSEAWYLTAFGTQVSEVQILSPRPNSTPPPFNEHLASRGFFFAPTSRTRRRRGRCLRRCPGRWVSRVHATGREGTGSVRLGAQSLRWTDRKSVV